MIVEVATRIGFFETLGLLILVSIAGAWLLKREGTAAWRRLRAALDRGEIPTREAIDGALILFGGALLLTPGFLTDVVGLLLVLPGSRSAARVWMRRMAGLVVVRRFGAAGVAASTGKRAYDARVVRSKQGDGSPSPTPSPEPFPYELPHPSDEDDSPDRG